MDTTSSLTRLTQNNTKKATFQRQGNAKLRKMAVAAQYDAVPTSPNTPDITRHYGDNIHKKTKPNTKKNKQKKKQNIKHW